MKKSVILMIMAVYILSITIVGFFGTKVLTYNENVYVNKIDIYAVMLGEEELEIKTNSDNIKFCICYDFVPGITFELKYHVYPDNATDKSVKFSYDKDKNIATMNDNFVVFNDGGAVTITVKPADGSGSSASDTIKIICYDI